MRRAWSSRRVLLPGSGTDQREAVGPAPGSGFDFGFSLGPHRTDRFRPALKNAYWGASVLCEAAGMEWRRRDRRKFSLTMEDPPGLPARSCFEAAAEYSRTREQFGQKIGGFQLTQSKLA